MIKAVRINNPGDNDNRDIVERLNEFFEANRLRKADIVHISTLNNPNPYAGPLAYYILYDDGQ